ncbi:VWA domain-containing protein, partial [Candidatus Poribacteria bacterium]|nr:VWA domain-containing protein [Candidatus Poribacteria bacterium]
SISPSANAPNVQYTSRRGDALRATSMSNNWGGSGSSGGTKTTASYIKMMKAIADELIKANTSGKVDLILLIDETASMVDNIRGIRAYFDLIFDAFERNKIDVNYGLVTFTDKTKTFGFTNDFGKFNNWLFKINVDHGGDISEAGLDALMDAVNKFKFRKNAQRHFIYASDAAFHDADYDGKSRYSLDEVIDTLQRNAIRVDVIGLDYLPIKQIALATEGTWRAIPGKGYLEYVPTITQTVKMLSKLGTLSIDGNTHVSDTINVHINNPPRPKQLTLTWKVLNPLGERCYGPFTQKTEIPNDNSTIVRLNPKLDQSDFQTIPGTYTVIYKLENDRGHKSILRRTIKYSK